MRILIKISAAPYIKTTAQALKYTKTQIRSTVFDVTSDEML
jgi:hypothetical protein